MSMISTTIAASLLCGLLAMQPAQEPAPEESGDEAPALSLDELLGLDPDEVESGAAEQAERENEKELERRLAAGEINDLFQLALERMAESALLLDVRLDAGLGTQRVQQDILKKLDQLIDKAKQNQQQMSAGSSSNPSRSGQSQKDPPPRRDAGATSRRKPGEQQDGQATEPPPRQEGDIDTELQEEGSEWGHLPQRFREMLLQGRNEKFSSLYEHLTREYYKRLAEEG